MVATYREDYEMVHSNEARRYNLEGLDSATYRKEEEERESLTGWGKDLQVCFTRFPG